MNASVAAAAEAAEAAVQRCIALTGGSEADAMLRAIDDGLVAYLTARATRAPHVPQGPRQRARALKQFRRAPLLLSHFSPLRPFSPSARSPSTRSCGSKGSSSAWWAPGREEAPTVPRSSSAAQPPPPPRRRSGSGAQRNLRRTRLGTRRMPRRRPRTRRMCRGRWSCWGWLGRSRRDSRSWRPSSRCLGGALVADPRAHDAARCYVLFLNARGI